MSSCLLLVLSRNFDLLLDAPNPVESVDQHRSFWYAGCGCDISGDYSQLPELHAASS